MHAAGDAPVEARDLAFTYGPRGVMARLGRTAARPALDGVSFSVGRGEVFGILGPNGAGKTTLMKCLGTVYVPSRGELSVLGHRLPGGEEAVRPRIGVAFAEFERAFSFRLTGRQNLRYFQSFYGAQGHEARARVDVVLETVGLASKADELFQHYSTGMKQRLGLARALLADPDVLLLDEPTAGLDARTSRELATTVRGLAADGVTIVYTTHRLGEAGALCDRVLVLRDGRVAAMARPQDLARLARDVRVLDVEVDGVLPPTLGGLASAPGIRRVEAEDRHHLRIEVTDVDDGCRALLKWLAAHDLKATRIASDAAGLTEAFIAITEGELDASGGVEA